MKLYPAPWYPESPRILWELLEERPAEACISHRKMPTWDEHHRFVFSLPYKAWYIIEIGETVGECPVGCVYLTRQDEIGISIYKRHQGKGYGPQAIKLLMAEHPEVTRFLANVAPYNARSLNVFEDLGFNIIQHTLEFRHAD